MQKIIMICVLLIVNLVLCEINFANAKSIGHNQACLIEPKRNINRHDGVVTKRIGIVIFRSSS